MKSRVFFKCKVLEVSFHNPALPQSLSIPLPFTTATTLSQREVLPLAQREVRENPQHFIDKEQREREGQRQA